MAARFILRFLLLVTSTDPAPERAYHPVERDLGGFWRFTRGDSPAWAAPAYDDRGWTTLHVPAEWERKFPGVDGMGWYRRDVDVPLALAGAPLGVLFGAVGDAFEVYWNGIRIGGGGRLPPGFAEAAGPTLLLVPQAARDARAAGRPHVLAVRVYNHYAYGGLMGGVTLGRYDRLGPRLWGRDVVIGGLVSFFLAIFLYHLTFWLSRRNAREHLYCAVFSLGVSLYAASYSPGLAALLMPHVQPYRVGLAGLLVAATFLTALVYRLVDVRITQGDKGVVALFLSTAVATLAVPLAVLVHLVDVVEVCIGAVLLGVVVRACTMAAGRRAKGYTLVAAGTAAFAGSLAYDALAYLAVVPAARIPAGIPLFGVGYVMLVAAVGITLARRWTNTEITALTDTLTGLARRHVLEDALRLEAVRLRRSEESVALLLADLDFFKQVNDNLGHGTGDRVLARVGQLLRATASARALPVRYGGEEFAVLLYGARMHEALAFAERFRGDLHQARVPTPHGDIQVTASIGVAVGGAGTRPETLIEAADRALYRAKDEGRDRVIAVDVRTSGGIVPGAA